MVALYHLLHLLLLFTSKSMAIIESVNTLHPWCPESCGGVRIPYPFGIGLECFMPGFEVTCNTTDNVTYTPYLGETPLLGIYLTSGQARVNMPVSAQCNNSTNNSPTSLVWSNDLSASPYRYNPDKNKFVVIGCGTLGYLNFTNNQNYLYEGGCFSGCDKLESLTNGSCTGIGCCQTSIPKGTYLVNFSFDPSFTNPGFSPCGYAMLTEEDGFTFNTRYITTDMLYNQTMSAVIDWAIANTTCATASTNKSTFACISSNSVCVESSSELGYLCQCSDGYEGNSYLEEGCQGLSLPPSLPPSPFLLFFGK